jgi:ABC-type bacteriocin/lantibiotic exporter with double-glycine peptidase domain
MMADSFPPRYHESVGVGGKNLSGGQRQIVWLLRSLMSPAPLVVMDEPTSALDPESRTDIIKLLKSSFQGRTLLVVTHDPVVKQMAKNVIEMSEGNVKASLRASSHGSFNGAHI